MNRHYGIKLPIVIMKMAIKSLEMTGLLITAQIVQKIYVKIS